VATTTDIRKWAKEHGHDVGPKGPIASDVIAQYEAEHPDAAGGLPPEDESTTAAAAPPDGGRVAEQRPRQPKPAGGHGRGFLARLRGGAQPTGRAAAARRPRVARVSLANLIEDAWGQMAWASSSLPPMQRLLQAQAPFAGIALEDALAGTIVDRALQPVARAEDKAKAVGGLLMPPMALMLVMATAPRPEVIQTTEGEQLAWPEATTQHKAAIMSLRWSLMLWSEAGAARLEEYRARAEANTDRGRQADAFMAWILGLPESGPGPADEAVAAEDEAVRRAQAMFGGEGPADGGRM
jgi:hypothetical protein